MAPLRRISILLTCLVAVCANGCRHFPAWSNVERISASAGTDKARQMALEELDAGRKFVLANKMTKARQAFQRAVELDPDSGVAHNNLGSALFAFHEFYSAAWEFERAGELMPDNPEPLVNLGLVFEAADRPEEAIPYYRRALALTPENPLAIGNLARIQVREDIDHEATRELLQRLVLVDPRPEWVRWAEDLLATRYRDPNRFPLLPTPNPSAPVVYPATGAPPPLAPPAPSPRAAPASEDALPSPNRSSIEESESAPVPGASGAPSSGPGVVEEIPAPLRSRRP